MFRAQAALLASACLALAPAAFAETHHASHKPHAKGHAEETPSKRAKLRPADDTSSPRGRAHAVKASSTGKHRRQADEEADAARSKSRRHEAEATTDEEADAAPSRSSRHHGKSSHADEEADATPSKSRRHGKTAAAEEAAATVSKASKRRHGEASTDEEQADAPRSRSERARGEEGEGSSLIRADVRSTKTCVAAHVRLHGRPHGSRARLALQRECAKEVEAARRHAEEEIAIRNWTPPHGPLIYQGALPRSTAAAAEPPIAAPPIPAPPISALPADPAAAPAPADPSAPAGQTARADTSKPPPSSAPAAGAAAVAQTPAPQPLGGIFGLFRRRGAPERKPGEPVPTLAELVGSDETRLKAELGEPELMRAEGDGALWTYRLPACALYVFLGRDNPTSAWKVKGAQAGPLKRGEQAPEVDVCLKSGRS